MSTAPTDTSLEGSTNLSAAATIIADPQGSSSSEQPQGPLSLEYITLKEKLGDLVDLLAGNAPVITPLNNHLFSSGLIANAVHIAVETIGLPPYNRANKLIDAVLAKLKSHPDPNNLFTSLITAIHKVGLITMATILRECFRKKGGHIDINLEQAQAVNDQPLQLADTATAAQPSTLSQTQSSSSTSPTVIELSSKGEVATNIENLHSHFASLDSKLRDEFEELVEKGHVKLKAIARSAATYLSIPVASLKYTNVDELFDSLKTFYNFFNCGVLRHLTDTYDLSIVQTELTQYIDNVDKFSESSQLKHIQSTIKEKLSHLPASPSTSDQTKPVVIKLHDRWEEMTLKNFKKVLQHHFQPKFADLFSLIDIEPGSVIITLLIPTTHTQYLIDTIRTKADSMNRLGIMEIVVDNNTMPIRREDDNNFDNSLNQSVKVGDSFEVSVLLQLGANPNNKDGKGKYPVEIAIEGGHNEVILALISGGAIKTTGFYTPQSHRKVVYCAGSDQVSTQLSKSMDTCLSTHGKIDIKPIPHTITSGSITPPQSTTNEMLNFDDIQTSTVTDLTCSTKANASDVSLGAKKPNNVTKKMTLKDQKQSAITVVGHVQGESDTLLLLSVNRVPVPPTSENKEYPSSFAELKFTDEPDCLDPFPDPNAPKRVKMNCGHAVEPNTLTAYCRSLLDQHIFKFTCPAIIDSKTKQCGKEWEYTDVRLAALLNDAEMQYFESKMSEYAASQYYDKKECPGCRSLTEQIDLNNLRVHCPICTKKKGRNYDFCWQCLREWTGPTTSSEKCGSESCIHPNIPSIRDAPIVIISGCSVPNRRACPTCGKVIEHTTEGCKNVICPRCKKEFCFLCLELTVDCQKAAPGSWYGACAKPVAPEQTVIPVWSRNI